MSELERRIKNPPINQPTEQPEFNNTPSPAPMTLYDALKIGYTRNEGKQQAELKKYGYNLDKSLTNYDHLTAFNPETKKLLYVVNGTNPKRPADYLTDIDLAFGNLKKTPRYKSDRRDYKTAKQKYNESNVVIAGHSLGGNIASKLDKGNNVDVFTFNTASTFGEKTNNREYAFRTLNDIVSTLKVGNVKSVTQKGKSFPIIATHDIRNIKGEKIIL